MSKEWDATSWKSVVAGAMGGLVGALAMNQFQAAIAAISKAADEKRRKREGWPEPAKKADGGGDDATIKAAQAISSKVFAHELTEGEKAWAGPLVHYSMGAGLGGVYGMLAQTREPSVGQGLEYGAVVWALADETAVPSLGLSQPPTRTPLSGHLKALGSHLVFGAVTHLSRKLILS